MITLFKDTPDSGQVLSKNVLDKTLVSEILHQNEIHDTIISISTLYLGAPIDDTDLVLNKSLRLMGEVLDVDRIHMHDYDYERKECVTLYEWCEKGISSTLKNHESVPLDLISDMVSVHNNGDHILIDDVEFLPEGLPKQVLKKQQIKSVLTVPTMLDGRCVGFAGFDLVRKRKSFSVKEISLLKLYSNITVSFLSRTKGENRIKKLLEKTSVQNKRLKDFSFIASHNIRSAAANLTGISDLLIDNPTDKDYLNMLKSSVAKLNLSIVSVNDILDAEKKLDFMEFELCNISDFIKVSLKNHSNAISTLGVDIICDLPRKVFVQAIPTYLESIFNEVIGNALKYGVNKKSKKILIDCATNEKEVVIRIKDFGDGLNIEKHKGRLFQIGARFHAESCDSFGMGLFITKHQVNTIGGKIALKSEEKKGFSVLITFERGAEKSTRIDLKA